MGLKKQTPTWAIAQNYVFVSLNFTCKNGLRNTLTLTQHNLYMERAYNVCWILHKSTSTDSFTEWNWAKWKKHEENKNKTIAILFATFYRVFHWNRQTRFYTKCILKCRTHVEPHRAAVSVSVYCWVALFSYVC